MIRKLITALALRKRKTALYLLPYCIVGLVYHHTPDSTIHGRPFPIVREVREKPQESEV